MTEIASMTETDVATAIANQSVVDTDHVSREVGYGHIFSGGENGENMTVDDHHHILGDRKMRAAFEREVVSVRMRVSVEQSTRSEQRRRVGLRACAQWLLLRRRDRNRECTRCLGLS